MRHDSLWAIFRGSSQKVGLIDLDSLDDGSGMMMSTNTMNRLVRLTRIGRTTCFKHLVLWIAFLALTIVVFPVLATETQLPSAKLRVTEYGLYSRGTERTVPDANAPSGQSRRTAGERLKAQTRQVPLEMGVSFGFCFELSEFQVGRTPDVRVLVSHPEIVRTDGSRRSAYNLKPELFRDGAVLLSCLGYGFDHRFELVPGTWRFEVMIDQSVVATEEFYASAQTNSGIASFRDGRFSALLAFTETPDQFLSEWYQAPRPGYRPNLVASYSVALGKPVTGFVFFGNCPPAGAARCRLTADMKVYRADGRLVESRSGLPVWTQEQPPPRGPMILGEARMEVKVDGDGGVGRYRIDVLLHEESSGNSGVLTWDLEVTK